MKSLRDTDIKHKKVFLRVDFNVKVKEGKIDSDNRLNAVLPTIKYLIDSNAKIIIGTHLGRPEGKFCAEFSAVPVAQRLATLLGREVVATDHVTGPSVKEKASNLKSGEILFIGNLRFHPGEESNDDNFAKELASYSEVFVNDAFAVCHRANASVAAITKHLPSCAGFLLESEITTLELLIKEPVKPFCLVVGGAKIKDKAGILENLADRVDEVFVGGAVGNTFLSAKGEDVGNSLFERDMVPKCKEILEKYGPKIVLPMDTVKKIEADGTFAMLDVGPKTAEQYGIRIKEAATVFWNGNMGYSEDSRFAAGTLAIAKAMSENPNTKVVAGGDTVSFVESQGMRDKFTFVSTGGGATMEFLAGKELPGIVALNNEIPPK